MDEHVQPTLIIDTLHGTDDGGAVCCGTFQIGEKDYQFYLNGKVDFTSSIIVKEKE